MCGTLSMELRSRTCGQHVIVLLFSPGLCVVLFRRSQDSTDSMLHHLMGEWGLDAGSSSTFETSL